MWLPARCFIKRGRWIKCSPLKVKGRVWKWFLFGTHSKPVLPLIKYPRTVLSRKSRPDGANTHQILTRSFGCEMQMERMTTLLQLMCSNRWMWDAFMTSSAAVNKCFFHSSLGPAAVTASASDGHMSANLRLGYTRERCPQTITHWYILCPPINAKIFLGTVTKSWPVS